MQSFVSAQKDVASAIWQIDVITVELNLKISNLSKPYEN